MSVINETTGEQHTEFPLQCGDWHKIAEKKKVPTTETPKIISLASAFTTPELCQANNWGPGDQLYCDNHNGKQTTLTIIRVDEDYVIVHVNGVPIERSFSLNIHDWRRIVDSPAPKEEDVTATLLLKEAANAIHNAVQYISLVVHHGAAKDWNKIPAHQRSFLLEVASQLGQNLIEMDGILKELKN